MGVNGVAAANRLRGFTNIKGGMCLFYVWQAYKAEGARADGSYPTALAGWYGSPGKHEGDRNPPAGVPVWFGAKESSNAGDVVISLGGGRVVATDYPRYGVVGVCTIDERQRQIGRPYLGWTETILGASIDSGRPAPKPEPAQGGAAAPIIRQENEHMAHIAHVKPSEGNPSGRFLITPNGAGLPTAVALGGGAAANGFPEVEITDFQKQFWQTVELR